MSQPATKARKRKNAQDDDSKGTKRDRCTLCLDASLSEKLSVEAHRRKLDRSDVINLILSDALKHIVISIRAQSTESANPPAESSEAKLAVA